MRQELNLKATREDEDLGTTIDKQDQIPSSPEINKHEVGVGV